MTNPGNGAIGNRIYRISTDGIVNDVTAQWTKCQETTKEGIEFILVSETISILVN